MSIFSDIVENVEIHLGVASHEWGGIDSAKIVAAVILEYENSIMVSLNERGIPKKDES